MIYESRSIRVKMIREPELHTNKETSVKTIFKSYKLGQTILSFVVDIHFFQCFRHKIEGIFLPKLVPKRSPTSQKRELPKSSLFLYLFGGSRCQRVRLGFCKIFPFTPISPQFHPQKCCL